MLAENTDDLDEFDASMVKEDDLMDDVQEKRGKKDKEKEFWQWIHRIRHNN